ncbi:Crp/Fnr family transcriptional regulator [Hyphococcus sp.]|uniref:Crp/Fnr family transcriptional regulator n=1 Tax=Hyphococcus sp. TaxID=2038636 RepID=UPI003CCB9E36
MSAVPVETESTEINELQLLGSIAPFRGLPDAVLSLLYEHSERRAYSAGQTVFSLGQYDGAEFVVVLDGALRISIADGGSGAMTIDDVNAGQAFGLEFAMAEPDPAGFQQLGATAAVDCDLIFIDAAEFKSLAGGRPSLMRNIAIYLAGQLSESKMRTDAAQAAPMQRVYVALLKSIERDALTGQWKINRMPKHRELADQAGVDESIAAGAVASLIQDGVAQREYPGLIINDMGQLNRLAS